MNIIREWFVKLTGAHITFPIHDAAMAGDLEKVRVMPKGNPRLVFSRDDEDRTPLHHGVAWGRQNVVELLLVSGADVNAKGGFGDTTALQGLEGSLYWEKENYKAVGA